MKKTSGNWKKKSVGWQSVHTSVNNSSTSSTTSVISCPTVKSIPPEIWNSYNDVDIELPRSLIAANSQHQVNVPFGKRLESKISTVMTADSGKTIETIALIPAAVEPIIQPNVIAPAVQVNEPVNNAVNHNNHDEKKIMAAPPIQLVDYDLNDYHPIDFEFRPIFRSMPFIKIVDNVIRSIHGFVHTIPYLSSIYPIMDNARNTMDTIRVKRYRHIGMYKRLLSDSRTLGDRFIPLQQTNILIVRYEITQFLSDVDEEKLEKDVNYDLFLNIYKYILKLDTVNSKIIQDYFVRETTLNVPVHDIDVYLNTIEFALDYHEFIKQSRLQMQDFYSSAIQPMDELISTVIGSWTTISHKTFQLRKNWLSNADT